MSKRETNHIINVIIAQYTSYPHGEMDAYLFCLREVAMAEVSLTASPLVTNPLKIEDLTLLEEVASRTAGVSRLEMCIQCGSCGGSCPSAAIMDHTPRMLFAMLRAGMREDALKSNTYWMCVSCYHCVVRCPQNVHIADVMYTLEEHGDPSQALSGLHRA